MSSRPLFILSAILAIGVFSGCWWTVKPVPPPKPPEPAPLAPVTSASVADSKADNAVLESQAKAAAKAAANITTALNANQKNPDGAPKATVDAEGKLALANLNTNPDGKELIEGERRARLIAEGRADEARKLYEQASSSASANAAEIARLKEVARVTQATLDKTIQDTDQRIKDAAAKAKAEYDAKLEQAKLDAEAAQQKLIGYIFFGGGALCVALACAVLFLAQYVPQFGPRLALGIGAAGLSLIACGIAIREALQHPWIIWSTLGLFVVALGISAGIFYANHHHEVSKPALP